MYDALNVLMAMDIISKEKKEIKWKGLPPSSASHQLLTVGDGGGGEGGERRGQVQCWAGEWAAAAAGSSADFLRRDLLAHAQTLELEMVRCFRSWFQAAHPSASHEPSRRVVDVHWLCIITYDYSLNASCPARLVCTQPSKGFCALRVPWMAVCRFGINGVPEAFFRPHGPPERERFPASKQHPLATSLCPFTTDHPSQRPTTLHPRP